MLHSHVCKQPLAFCISILLISLDLTKLPRISWATVAAQGSCKAAKFSWPTDTYSSHCSHNCKRKKINLKQQFNVFCTLPLVPLGNFKLKSRQKIAWRPRLPYSCVKLKSYTYRIKVSWYLLKNKFSDPFYTHYYYNITVRVSHTHTQNKHHLLGG